MSSDYSPSLDYGTSPMDEKLPLPPVQDTYRAMYVSQMGDLSPVSVTPLDATSKSPEDLIARPKTTLRRKETIMSKETAPMMSVPKGTESGRDGIKRYQPPRKAKSKTSHQTSYSGITAPSGASARILAKHRSVWTEPVASGFMDYPDLARQELCSTCSQIVTSKDSISGGMATPTSSVSYSTTSTHHTDSGSDTSSSDGRTDTLSPESERAVQKLLDQEGL